MLKLVKYLKPYILLLILLIGLVYLQVQMNLLLPDYMADIVNKGIIGKDMSQIYSTGLSMLIVTAIGAVASIIVGFLSSRIATGFAYDIREKVLKHLMVRRTRTSVIKYYAKDLEKQGLKKYY